MRSALTIIRDKEYNTWERELGLEMLAMHYEALFIREILKAMQEGNSKVIPGLTVKALNKSLPHFVEVLNAYVENHADLLDGIKVGREIGVKEKLTVFLHILEPVTVASIVFTNIVKLSGNAGGVDEMALINHVFESLHVHLKFAEMGGKNVPDTLKPV